MAKAEGKRHVKRNLKKKKKREQGAGEILSMKVASN